jgi:hypothetical protein
MTIETFAQANGLRTKRDSDGLPTVPGRLGHVYEGFSDGMLGACFLPPPTPKDRSGKWTPKAWGNFRRAGLAVGMTLLQSGDSEGCLLFDPTNLEHVRLVRKALGLKVRRRLSEERRAQAIETLQNFRSNPRLTDPLAL